MKVVTCISDRQNSGYLYFLKASCDHRRLELITLLFPGRWTSHRIKDVLLIRYLKSVPRDEVVLFTDGYDTMLLASEAEILEKYAAFRRPIVFTAEKNCWPDPELAYLYPTSSTSAKYLNCGGFIGLAGVLLELMEENREVRAAFHDLQPRRAVDPVTSSSQVSPNVRRRLAWSNQFDWTLTFLRHQELMALDYRSSIFLELAPDLAVLEANHADFRQRGEASSLYRSELERLSRDCAVEGGRIHFRDGGTTPCHVHFNGPVAKRIAHNGHFSDLMPWLDRDG